MCLVFEVRGQRNAKVGWTQGQGQRRVTGRAMYRDLVWRFGSNAVAFIGSMILGLGNLMRAFDAQGSGNVMRWFGLEGTYDLSDKIRRFVHGWLTQVFSFLLPAVFPYPLVHMFEYFAPRGSRVCDRRHTDTYVCYNPNTETFVLHWTAASSHEAHT